MTDLSFFEQAISFVLHIDQHLFALVAEYGALLYLFLFIVVFCETGLVVTPFLPGDSLLFAAGTVAGAGHLSYPVCMLVLFVAGIALMSPVKFLSFNITGAILWVVGLVSAGYFLGNIPIVKNNFSVVIYGIIIVSVLPVVIEFIRAKIKK